MRVRYLDSSAVETFLDALGAAASRANEIDVATAFLTKAGSQQLCELATRLVGAKARKRFRVVVGLWMQVTEPSALRSLLDDNSIHLRIAKSPGFHVKHASLRNTRDFTSFTGSANLTAKGLGGIGELVAEVRDRRGSLADTGESDMFRRLWDATYPDELTKELIDAYSANWSPRLRIVETEATKASRSLLKQFGRRASARRKPTDDGSTLWLPITGTLSHATEKAVLAQGKRGSGEVFGLGHRSIYDRIQSGARRAWVLDLRGGPSDRTLELHDALEGIDLLTDDGRYFAVASPALRSVKLDDETRARLKQLGLVTRIDSLRSAFRVLRSGDKTKAKTLEGMSTRTRKK